MSGSRTPSRFRFGPFRTYRMRVSGIRSQNRRAAARNRARVVAQVALGAKRAGKKGDVGGGRWRQAGRTTPSAAFVEARQGAIADLGQRCYDEPCPPITTTA